MGNKKVCVGMAFALSFLGIVAFAPSSLIVHAHAAQVKTKWVDIPSKNIQKMPDYAHIELFDFAFAATEVTYDQWYEQRLWAQSKGYVFAQLGAEGSKGTDGAIPTKDAQQPVTNVSLPDVLVWLNALSEREGWDPVYRLANGQVFKNAKQYNTAVMIGSYDGARLPTKAEWNGALARTKEQNLLDVAWVKSNAQGKTQPVGQKMANKFGLYDMTGNVNEWVTWDARTFGVEVLGQSYADAGDMYASNRCSFRTCTANEANDETGFRIARSLLTNMTDAPLTIKRPFAGETAQKTVDSSMYSGTIVWSPALFGDVFAPNTVYTAVITLQPKKSASINTVRANAFRMFEAGRITHAEKSGVVTIVFPRTEPTRTQLMPLPLDAFRVIPLTKENTLTPVRLSPVVLGHTEVTIGEWEEVVRWAQTNGYTFVRKGQEGAGDAVRRYEPVTDVALYDVLVWLNAYSQKEGFDPVYRTRDGAVIKDGASIKSIDRTAIPRYNGFRLPTSIEYEVAGRYLGTEKPSFVVARDTLITTKEGKKAHYWATHRGFENSSYDNYGLYVKERHFARIPLFATIRTVVYDRSQPGRTIPVTWDVPNALGLYGLNAYPNAQERVMDLDNDNELMLDEFNNTTYATVVPKDAKNQVIGFRIAQTRVQNVQEVAISLPAPTAHDRAVTNLDSSFYAAKIRWEPQPKDGVFAPDTAYTAVISLTAKKPFSLNNINANTFRVSSAMNTRHAARSGQIRAVFPATAKTIKAQLVRVPASLVRQVPDESQDEKSASVQKRNDFFIGNTEVTYDKWYEVAQWAKANGFSFVPSDQSVQGDVEGREGSKGKNGAVPTVRRHEPVVVPWMQAIIWLNAYSKKSGLQPVYYNNKDQLIDRPEKVQPNLPQSMQVAVRAGNGYRLPTLKEWRIAARWIGTKAPADGAIANKALKTKEGNMTYYWTPKNYASGAVASLDDAVATQRVAWYEQNGGGKTKDVGQKQPNALGLYDMSGNVAEYV
ncbi:MAG: SUMF1/EgtB/PvdO family nonheme iron enzyme, partial [Paenibacillaceae bacterium]|nr:SUMF1/EgtB/PvdO family nonheme iron enzyme [Paenibacillaceae bacterium]